MGGQGSRTSIAVVSLLLSAPPFLSEGGADSLGRSVSISSGAIDDAIGIGAAAGAAGANTGAGFDFDFGFGCGVGVSVWAEAGAGAGTVWAKGGFIPCRPRLSSSSTCSGSSARTKVARDRREAAEGGPLLRGMARRTVRGCGQSTCPSQGPGKRLRSVALRVLGQSRCRDLLGCSQVRKRMVGADGCTVYDTVSILVIGVWYEQL